MEHIRFLVDQNIHAVVGTSGIGDEQAEQIRHWLAPKPEIGVMVVPNFAIGAVLTARFARQAARFFESAEIIERHHAGKIDAPSGTAIATARGIGAARAAAGLGPVPAVATRSTGSTCTRCACLGWWPTRRSCSAAPARP